MKFTCTQHILLNGTKIIIPSAKTLVFSPRYRYGVCILVKRYIKCICQPRYIILFYETGRVILPNIGKHKNIITHY